MSKENRILLTVGAFVVLVITAVAIFRAQPGGYATPRDQLDANLRALGTALETYRSVVGTLPTQEQGLAALTAKPTASPVPAQWHQMMGALPRDPWGEPYLYRYPPRRSHQGFDVYSKGPDKVSDTPDDVGNWSGEK